MQRDSIAAILGASGDAIARSNLRVKINATLYTPIQTPTQELKDTRSAIR